MNTLELVLTTALAISNVWWAIAYRRLAVRHVETIGALWASMLDRR